MQPFDYIEIAKRLKYYRAKSGYSLQDLAEKTGMSKSTLQRYETGFIKNIPLSKLKVLSEAIGCSPDELVGTDLDKSVDGSLKFDNILPINIKKIPLLGEIACGEPIIADNAIESYVAVGTELKADFAIKAKGDSMIGARIYDGDIVFIREQPEVENGEIAAVIIEDEATLKRVYYYPQSQKLALNAENPRYEPMIYVGEELDHIKILGKAIAFQSDVK